MRSLSPVQVGHHLQQLCHLVTLARCVPGNEGILAQGFSLLQGMQHYCMQAIGAKELLQAGQLPQDVTRALDDCCSVAPSNATLRTVTAAPILWHTYTLTTAVQLGLNPPAADSEVWLVPELCSHKAKVLINEPEVQDVPC